MKYVEIYKIFLQKKSMGFLFDLIKDGVKIREGIRLEDVGEGVLRFEGYMIDAIDEIKYFNTHKYVFKGREGDIMVQSYQPLPDELRSL